jgi:opacity protein-like surface antigen
MKLNIMKTGGLFLTSILLLTAPAAYADWSAGISAANAPITANDLGTIGGSADGWRAHFKYMFNKNFGFEGGLSKYGSPDDQSVPSNMHVDTEAYDIYAVAYYPLDINDSGIYAKVGYVSMDSESEVNDTNETHHKNDTLALSFGGEYYITERFGLRAELEWFDSAISGELKYSLGGVVRF